MTGNENFKNISSLIPKSSGFIDWNALSRTSLGPILTEMSQTPQEPKYHGEGDVLTHTKMVCEALIKDHEYIMGNEIEKTVLFLATLLHDIGKTRCTSVIDGEIRSPRHSLVGAVMAREFLWRELGLSGSHDNIQVREGICNLIKYHSFPPYAITNERPEFKTLMIAANGELAKYFSIEMLCALERADVKGRISNDGEETLEKIECCRLIAEEAECLSSPFEFPDDFSKRSYFRGKTLFRGQELFNDSWGEIILMSGLPGTGKDTWIRENYPHLPMISLDDIRKKLKIRPTDNQSAVISHAHELAKEYLRKKQPFVWNATNITFQIRDMQISLFENYGASVKTVYLETMWREQLRRNSERAGEKVVPLGAIERMLSKLEMPERFECEAVLWKSV